MELLIICGFKSMPWTAMRRTMITFFLGRDIFPEYPFTTLLTIPPNPLQFDACLQPPASSQHLDDLSPVQVNDCSQQPTTSSQPSNDLSSEVVDQRQKKSRESKYTKAIGTLTDLRTDIRCKRRVMAGGRSFWRYILSYADKHKISLQDLAHVMTDSMKTGKRIGNSFQSEACSRFTKDILKGLFVNCPVDFSTQLAVACKTGNTNDVITVIRNSLKVNSMKYNIIPSVRAIQESSTNVMKQFISICEPEITFSGFRCNLVKCVKFVAHILFGKEDIEELFVDLWGDGCEIGGVEMTRMCFRILKDFNTKVSAQSTKCTFCFCTYRGKDSRFALEQNVGPTKVGDQESGWLYQQTLELTRQGAHVTFSGDAPFLNRLVLGISTDLGSKYPSQLAIYVGKDASYLPSKCDPVSGLRRDLKVPFITEIPRESLVYFDDVRSIVPDVPHMITRIVEVDLKKMAQKLCREKKPFSKVYFHISFILTMFNFNEK